jgi:hypothetical protein
MAGIYIASTDAGHSISTCSVQNIVASTSASAAVKVMGIYTYGSGIITKSYISGLKSAATSSTAAIKGIAVTNTDSWNIYNSVVLIDNSGNTNSPIITGIDAGSTGTTNKIYHNSVKIYGSASSGSANSTAFMISAAGTTTVKNNVWQNVRTGGSGSHYAVNVTNTSGTNTINYNYLETSASPIARWGASNQSAIGNWRTASGATTAEITGTITMDNTTGRSNNATIQTVGTNLSATVADDKLDVTRHTTPWMGAFEGFILPIELLYFNAILHAKVVHLTWATAAEINNDFFTVERSANGKDFFAILNQKGAGNSNSTSFYSDIDREPLTGVSYYRLKQIDFNGQFTYSKMIAIDLSDEKADVIYPNPTNGTVLYINLKDRSNSNATYYIWDALGAMVAKDELTINEQGVGEISLQQHSSIGIGSYYISIEAAPAFYHKKVVIY